MKTIRAALAAAAVAVGVTPAALATGEVSHSGREAFARAGLTPVAMEAPRYPKRVREEGACTVRFDIRADGRTADARARDCTSTLFKAEALRVVGALVYPARPGGATIEDQEVTFCWLGRETR